MSDSTPIAVQDLRKTFRRGLTGKPFDAVDGVTFQVLPGEVVGYIGRNGAGKSTTIKMLLGLLRPTSGRITLFGKDPSAPGARRAVGFLPEVPHFYEYLTAAEGLEFYGRLQGLSRADARAATPGLLERVGIPGVEQVRLAEFSKGMRQRFGVAQAIIGDPQIVILDEPLEGLDPLGRKALKDVIKDLRSAQRSVLFSTHVLSDVEDTADRVIMIDRGKVAVQGTIAELLSERGGEEHLEEFFVRVVEQSGVSAQPEGDPAPPEATA
ncbi:MAG: ABC transporter ATP-binding protein [Planctomycetota bacterium]|jgi:ABC-2 type transport system ATP-binding protein